MRRAAAFAKSGSEREVEEGYPEVGRSLRSSREESSVWAHVRPLCTSAKCHYRRKTWAFPRPRAHMHAHEASERADTHTCHTRKQARHLPESLRGLPRAHDHIISHAAARKGAQNREVRKAPREHCRGSRTLVSRSANPRSSDLDEARERNDRRPRRLWGID
jgi:hypothetical protein